MYQKLVAVLNWSGEVELGLSPQPAPDAMVVIHHICTPALHLLLTVCMLLTEGSSGSYNAQRSLQHCSSLNDSDELAGGFSPKHYYM